MKVMVLGATGFIGTSVMRRLEARGWEAVGVSRRGSTGTHVAADRRDASAIAKLVETVSADVVIDLLAMTLEETQPLLDALAGRARRYVLASSGDVYRRYSALHRQEPADHGQVRLSEHAPLRTRLYPYRGEVRRAPGDPQAWMDQYDKIPIEQAARHAGLDAVILRLPMVFGPGDRQRRFGWAIRAIATGPEVLGIDAEWAAWRTTYGFVDDVAEAMALAATHPAAGGKTFNVGLADEPEQAEWVRRLGRAVGWRGELRRLGREQRGEPQRRLLDGLDLSVSFVMDTSRIRRELGYREPTPPEAALQLTIEDELSRPA